MKKIMSLLFLACSLLGSAQKKTMVQDKEILFSITSGDF
jgi:hypothetical protein